MGLPQRDHIVPAVIIAFIQAQACGVRSLPWGIALRVILFSATCAAPGGASPSTAIVELSTTNQEEWVSATGQEQPSAIAALVLDMDGLLVDSETVSGEALRLFLRVRPQALCQYTG